MNYIFIHRYSLILFLFSLVWTFQYEFGSDAYEFSSERAEELKNEKSDLRFPMTDVLAVSLSPFDLAALIRSSIAFIEIHVRVKKIKPKRLKSFCERCDKDIDCAVNSLCGLTANGQFCLSYQSKLEENSPERVFQLSFGLSERCGKLSN